MIFIVHKKLSILLIFQRKFDCFTHLTIQEGNLKVWSLIKSGYYIVPNPYITLEKRLLTKARSTDNMFPNFF